MLWDSYHDFTGVNLKRNNTLFLKFADLFKSIGKEHQNGRWFCSFKDTLNDFTDINKNIQKEINNNSNGYWRMGLPLNASKEFDTELLETYYKSHGFTVDEKNDGKFKWITIKW